jgi:WD40 repeat protein
VRSIYKLRTGKSPAPLLSIRLLNVECHNSLQFPPTRRFPPGLKRALTSMFISTIAIAAIFTNGCSNPHSGDRNFPVEIKRDFDVQTSGAAVAVTWSPDGTRLAAASDYGEILSVWDNAGHPVQQIKRAGDGPILEGSIAFAHGASELLFAPPAGAPDGIALNVWDIGSGRIVSAIAGPEPGKSKFFNRAKFFINTPDQHFLIVGTSPAGPHLDFDKNIAVYDTSNWQIESSAKINSGIFSLNTFSAGQKITVGSSSNAIYIFDNMSSLSSKEYSSDKPSEYGDYIVQAVAGSPDGNTILGSVGMLLFKEGDIRAAGPTAWQSSIDPVWALRTSDGTRVASLKMAKPPIRQAVWDPKGRFVAFLDGNRGLFLWRPTESPARFKKIELPSQSMSLAISPDGTHLAVTTNFGVIVYKIV